MKQRTININCIPPYERTAYVRIADETDKSVGFEILVRKGKSKISGCDCQIEKWLLAGGHGRRSQLFWHGTRYC